MMSKNGRFVPLWEPKFLFFFVLVLKVQFCNYLNMLGNFIITEILGEIL